jgi:hypothetical protein
VPCSWTARVWAEWRVNNLTRAFRDVLLTLATYRGAGGIAHPSHETLASRVGCCVRTVQRALQAARDLDLVRWTERRVRAGWRWLRTSNAYRLAVPTRDIEPGSRPCRSTTGQKGRGGERLKKEGAGQGRKAAWEAMRQAAAALPDLLAMRRQLSEVQRRAAVEARLLRRNVVSA